MFDRQGPFFNILNFVLFIVQYQQKGINYDGLHFIFLYSNKVKKNNTTHLEQLHVKSMAFTS